MPHLFTNRPRQHAVFGEEPSLRHHFRWETFNAAAYQIGGIFFIAGSIIFLPAMAADMNVGAAIYIAGSLLYLVVTGHDMFEVLIYRRGIQTNPTIFDRLETWAAAAYLIGTILFTLGSIFFLSVAGLYTAGAWCFVIGSLLFVFGATINVLEIVQAGEMVTLQLMNLTALTFVTGSILFTVASIPYLWHVQSSSDRGVLDAFLAWQYLAGSILFLLGGVFNYWRAFMVANRHMARAQATSTI
jgi:hypothetical protein